MNPTDLYSLLIIFFCIVLAAFFSCAETAITSLGSLKTKHILNSRGQTVKHLNFWLNYPSRVLTTILIFNNSVNILASAVATELAARYYGDRAVGIATGVTAFLVLTFGEIIPKSFAKAHSEPIAIFSLKIIEVVYWITYPVVVFFSELAKLVIRIFGAKEANTPPITEEELEFLVDVGEKAGVLEETKQEMISSVFEFDETKVREIMTPRPDIQSLELNDTIEKAIKMISETGFSRFPVYEKHIDNIVGIFLAKDLLKHIHTHRDQNIKISDLIRDAFFVPESKLIIEVFKDLKMTQNHIAIVIDEYGGTAGLVTMEDILEEIVGEIQDEYDSERAEITELEDGTYDVSGLMNIDSFLEQFELEGKNLGVEQAEDIDTISGWMTQIVGDVPEIGQKIEIGPLKIEITEMKRHRIQRLKVSKVHKGESSLSKLKDSGEVEI